MNDKQILRELKNHKKIAEIIKRNTQDFMSGDTMLHESEQVEAISFKAVHDLADFLQEEDGKDFNREQFLKDCGVEQ